MIWFPFPTPHTNHTPTKLKVSANDFQTIHPFWIVLFSSLPRYSMLRCSMFFWYITCLQSPYLEIIFHGILVDITFPKKWMSLKSQPLVYFSLDKDYHLTSGMPSLFLLLVHKNLNHFFLIISIPLRDAGHNMPIYLNFLQHFLGQCQSISQESHWLHHWLAFFPYILYQPLLVIIEMWILKAFLKIWALKWEDIQDHSKLFLL